MGSKRRPGSIRSEDTFPEVATRSSLPPEGRADSGRSPERGGGRRMKLPADADPSAYQPQGEGSSEPSGPFTLRLFRPANPSRASYGAKS
jgi:hypothetical protein